MPPDEPAHREPVGGLVRVRLDLAYDGSEFAGWARQPGLRTVQGVVQTALGRVLRMPEEPVVTCAGRTDAGVHATGQVAHVDLPEPVWRSAAPDLARRLARALPPDVRVRSAVAAPAGFDARFAALSRSYRYRLADRAEGVDPLLRGFVVPHDRPLDVDRMTAAGRDLLGEHDFAAFCRPRPGASTVRTLLRLVAVRVDPGRVDLEVVADAFCHSMVRALVGVLLPVGDGRRPLTWPAQVLAAGRRDPAVQVAPAYGLVLEAVRYPPDVLLADRQRQARRRRDRPTRPA